jgi:hypothetical protein
MLLVTSSARLQLRRELIKTTTHETKKKTFFPARRQLKGDRSRRRRHPCTKATPPAGQMGGELISLALQVSDPARGSPS